MLLKRDRMQLLDIYNYIGTTLIKYGRFEPNRFMQILNTGFAETGYKEDNLVGRDGKAYGFWQLEYETVKDLLVNTVPSLLEKDAYYGDLAIMAEYYDEEKHKEICGSLGICSLEFQIRMVDVKYRTDEEPIPPYNNLYLQAKYWKRIYNTIEGEGTIEHFIREVSVII